MAKVREKLAAVANRQPESTGPRAVLQRILESQRAGNVIGRATRDFVVTCSAMLAPGDELRADLAAAGFRGVLEAQESAP